MEQSYHMMFQSPICYSCGVQRHVRCDCFKFFQRANHGGIRFKNTWYRRLITMEMVQWDFIISLKGGNLLLVFDHNVYHRGKIEDEDFYLEVMSSHT